MTGSGVQHELRQLARPDFETGSGCVTVVDLFAGCGGISLGVAQAAFAAGIAIDVKLAVDLEPAATSTFAANFPKATVETASVDDYFDGDLGARPTTLEKQTKADIGEIHLLAGGPPCQGHSNLNNRTRRDDPKNALYARMARAAEVLRPAFVLIENVPPVRHDISDVVGTTRTHLEKKGYTVAEATISLLPLGVAQRRKRHVMLASRTKTLRPDLVLKELAELEPETQRNLRWAIGDLENLTRSTLYDAPPGRRSTTPRRGPARTTSGECGTCSTTTSTTCRTPSGPTVTTTRTATSPCTVG